MRAPRTKQSLTDQAIVKVEKAAVDTADSLGREVSVRVREVCIRRSYGPRNNYRASGSSIEGDKLNYYMTYNSVTALSYTVNKGTDQLFRYQLEYMELGN